MSGRFAIVCAAVAAGIGIYGEYQPLSEQLHLLGGLAGLLALGGAVVWWIDHAKGLGVPRR